MSNNLSYFLTSLYLSDSDWALFRIVFSLFLISTISLYRYDWISDFPVEFYQPPLSIMSFYTDFPSKLVLQFFNLFIPILSIFVLLGFQSVISSLLLGISFIIVYSFVFSFGEISHVHFIPFTLILLSFSGWGNSFSLDLMLRKKWGNYKYIKVKMNVYPYYALLISFSYFTSGFSKFLGGWLNVNFQASYYHINKFILQNGQRGILADYLLSFESKIFWEVCDYIVVAIEILPFIFLLHLSFFRKSLLFLAFFHVLVYFLLDISFGFYPLFYLIFIVRWETSYLVGSLKRILNSVYSFKILLILGLISIFFTAGMIVFFYLDCLVAYKIALLLIDASLFLSFALVLLFYWESSIFNTNSIKN